MNTNLPTTSASSQETLPGRQQEENSPSLSKRRSRWLRLFDACILIFLCVALFAGTRPALFKNNTDAAKYQCYAMAFWHTLSITEREPWKTQCGFITRPITADYLDVIPPGQHTPTLLEKAERYGLPASFVNTIEQWQSPNQRFHALPNEYPMLVLVPFSLSLIVPSHWYQVAFAGWMGLFAIIIYYLLVRYRSRGSAMAFVVYLLAGCYATALGRFDLVPALLTLLAIIYADRSRWNWAYVYLALATLCKFYPVILLIPFLLQQQRELQGSWRMRQRWLSLGIFVALCSAVMLLSLALSAEGTLKPFTYFIGRPTQVESLQAAIVWFTSRHITHTPLSYRYSYGSFNIFGTPEKLVSTLSTALLLLGLAYIYWLQWRNKIDLAVSSVLTLLVIISTGKVFSPQYLIWVAPLIAYIGRASWKWLMPWTALSLLTTFIYPYLYGKALLHDLPNVSIFFPSIMVRDVVLLGIILGILLAATLGYLKPHHNRVEASQQTPLPTPAI
ncbi:glycosyltransferase family 87 protein [Ktedonobacter sp. SOSP1-85]|uniref:glycosyltransferase family 87 protein n=1 Tax=Ktedonobacter sp. SOSP1-85 TaxID=2778367 RepID=UPI0019154C1B|nr:glycosyltransferase family 87 protein [Ktedonobacter sp. SOSP1-85]